MPQLVGSLLGITEFVGGPSCCMFDSPFVALQNSQNSTVGFSSNQITWLISDGDSINSTIKIPLQTGLVPDSNESSYAHCGRWLNSAWLDQAGIIHGYIHQEWQCDYANNSYTNKSVGYAQSKDGLKFTVLTDSQLIAGNNFSLIHQTGEGDHTVVRLGEFLYMFFIEWNAP